MASLHIKCFDPIVDSTKIDLTLLMVLIDRQSADKSAFMKVLCFCLWIEKKIMISTGDIANQYTHYNRFLNELKQFHRINDEYFSDNTELMYDGEDMGLIRTAIADVCILPFKSISGYYIDEDGVFQNIMDNEIPMLSGNDLDGVSDWIEESVNKLNEILFALV